MQEIVDAMLSNKLHESRQINANEILSISIPLWDSCPPKKLQSGKNLIYSFRGERPFYPPTRSKFLSV